MPRNSPGQHARNTGPTRPDGRRRGTVFVARAHARTCAPALALALALALSAGPAAAAAPEAAPVRGPDLPAGVVLASCGPLRVDTQGLDVPPTVDVAVQVDARGAARSAEVLTELPDNTVRKAAVAHALTCSYLPGRADGQAVAGLVRLVLKVPQRAGNPPGATPAIGDVSACAPRAEDYPASAARRGQTGTTVIEFTVAPTGQLATFGITRSSGSLALDLTALVKLAGCSFKPGRAADGTPIGGSFTVEYIWELK